MIKSMAEEIVSNFDWMKREYFHLNATKELRVNKKIHSNGNMMKVRERSLTKYNPTLLVCFYRYNRYYSFRLQYCDCRCDFYYNIIYVCMYNVYCIHMRKQIRCIIPLLLHNSCHNMPYCHTPHTFSYSLVEISIMNPLMNDEAIGENSSSTWFLCWKR